MCIYFFCFWFYKLKKIFDSGQNVLKNFNKICKMFKKFKKKFFIDFGWFGERTLVSLLLLDETFELW